MRRPTPILLVLALVAIAASALAGSDGVAGKPRPDRDNGPGVTQVEPTEKDEKQDQAPKSGDGAVQAPQRKLDDARPPASEQRVQPPQYRQETKSTPSYSTQPSRDYTQPSVIRARPGNRESGDAGEVNVPQTSGYRRGSGGGPGDYRGGHGGPGRREPGRGWHGYHNEWRHRRFRYHGSWSFLFHFGPRIYFAPVHYPHVIRVPRTRVGVYVRQTGDDYVGEQFADAVREQLRNQGLRVVYSQDRAQLELYMVSMEQDPDDSGYGSTVSVSYVWYPGHRFITAQMVDVGIDQIDALAQSVAEYTDDIVDDYR